MTIAEQLEQKGRMEGMQLGEAKGRQEGRQEALLEIANMLSKGIDAETTFSVTGLTAADLEQVLH